jgi:hypothetical protein
MLGEYVVQMKLPTRCTGMVMIRYVICNITVCFSLPRCIVGRTSTLNPQSINQSASFGERISSLDGLKLSIHDVMEHGRNGRGHAHHACHLFSRQTAPIHTWL